MSDGQFIASLVSIFLILAITVAAHLNWLRGDSAFARIVIFTVALLAIGILGIQKVPPEWFDGSKAGFSLAATLCIGALLPGAARWFRTPLLLGMTVPLAVFNVLAHL